MKRHRYVAIAKGGPQVLEWQSFEPKHPKENEVAVQVEAVGVLLADVLWQMGITPMGPKHPFTPGYDVVGIIAEVGPNVVGLEKGQRVAAMIQYGGYTEWVCLSAEMVVPVPDRLDPRRAVAATTSYLTAYWLVHSEGKIQPDEIVLIHGAGGGTGSAVVEMACLAGARTYGTASQSKHGLVERKGGIPIDYKAGDFTKVLREREPQGVAFIVDPIGGECTSHSLGLLKPGGKLVATAMIQSFKSNNRMIAVRSMLRLPLWSLFHPGKKAYFWDIVATARKNLAVYRDNLKTVLHLLEEDRIDPMIGQVMALRDAPKAQQMLLDYQVAGKIVLVNS